MRPSRVSRPSSSYNRVSLGNLHNLMEGIPVPFDAIRCRYDRSTYQSRKGIQFLEGRQHRIRGRGVHEVEVDQVIDAHCLKHQDGRRQVLALNLRDRGRQHLGLERRLRIETEAFSGPRSAGTAGTLVGLRLGDRRDHERVHAQLGICEGLSANCFPELVRNGIVSTYHKRSVSRNPGLTCVVSNIYPLGARGSGIIWGKGETMHLPIT